MGTPREALDMVKSMIDKYQKIKNTNISMIKRKRRFRNNQPKSENQQQQEITFGTEYVHDQEY